jgi:hypothetical protein
MIVFPLKILSQRDALFGSDNVERALNRCWYTELAGILSRERKASAASLRDRAIAGHPSQFDAESSQNVLAQPGNLTCSLAAGPFLDNAARRG